VRLEAFQELAIASLTRSVAAVYVVSITQLFIHTQIFELVRLQRLGRVQHEEAQRRFLSIIQLFHRDHDGRGGSLLGLLVARVEAAVRNFYQSVDQSTACNPARLAEILSAIRRDVELNSLACESGADSDESWILALIRQLMTDFSAMLRADKLEGNRGGGWGAGGGSPERDMEFLMGVRAEGDARMQLNLLSQDLLEIIDSDLFAEVLAPPPLPSPLPPCLPPTLPPSLLPSCLPLYLLRCHYGGEGGIFSKVKRFASKCV